MARRHVTVRPAQGIDNRWQWWAYYSFPSLFEYGTECRGQQGYTKRHSCVRYSVLELLKHGIDLVYVNDGNGTFTEYRDGKIVVHPNVACTEGLAH